MKSQIDLVHDKFKNQTVFIIGGGNSLSGFDFKQLEGKCVVALNSAYKFVDDAVLYWMDSSWVRKQGEALTNHPSPYRFTSFHTIVPNPQLAGAYPLLQTGDFGYDSTLGQVRGNNSGTQALNFVATLQPKRIVLLGYDMGYVEGKSHFHDYQKPAQENVYVKQFIPSINSMASEIPVEVINCSSKTALTCFKIGQIEDYL